MAETTDQTPKQESGVPNDTFMTVPADPRIKTPEAATAHLSWVSGNEHIDYAATAAHLDVRSDTGALMGQMFSLSYVTLDGEGNPDPTRPITFCYNGGPG